MVLRSKGVRIAEGWRTSGDGDNPAGDLFTGGISAQIDIVCETTTGSGKCGTVCTGSRTNDCC